MKYIKRFYESRLELDHSAWDKLSSDIFNKTGEELKLWRGESSYLKSRSKEVSPGVYLVEHTLNRVPTDTPIELHDKLNKEFIKKFGWPVRNGVFCISNERAARNYAKITALKRNTAVAKTCQIIPVGDFEYCWSPKYKDLTVDLTQEIVNKMSDDEDFMIGDAIDILKNMDIASVKKIVSSYRDNDIHLSGGNEISINCSKYLMITI